MDSVVSYFRVLKSGIRISVLQVRKIDIDDAFQKLQYLDRVVGIGVVYDRQMQSSFSGDQYCPRHLRGEMRR